MEFLEKTKVIKALKESQSFKVNMFYSKHDYYCDIFPNFYVIIDTDSGGEAIFNVRGAWNWKKYTTCIHVWGHCDNYNDVTLLSSILTVQMLHLLLAFMN